MSLDSTLTTKNLKPETSPMSPLVSVIIPTKNSVVTLKKCLQSVKDQTYKNLEVTILSPNEDKELKELVSNHGYNFVHFTDGKNASRNRGAELAQGKFILHIDDDMWLSESVIKECVEFAEDKKYKAIAIKEVEEKTSGIYNALRRLEKRVVSYDTHIEAPRFIDRITYFKVGAINVDLDPIDEGDLKAKLEEAGVSYGVVTSEIVLSGRNRMSSISGRWYHMYKRGEKMVLFNTLHPQSTQLKSVTRGKAYFNKPKIIFENPFLGLMLIAVKTIDLLILNVGALSISSTDKKIINSIKNKIIFEKESSTYQSEFFEDSVGAKYVNKIEQDFLKKYLKDINKNLPLSILDIGPGGGRWSELLLNYFPNATVQACDLSVGMVEKLNEKFKSEKRFKAFVGDMQQLPFDNGVFDIVISIRAVKYAQDQRKVFNEISRILKYKGTAIIELPYFNVIYKIVKALNFFGKISEYANRIVLSNKTAIVDNILNTDLKLISFNIFSTIPATFYKNSKKKAILNFLRIIEASLPKVLFGRSIFIEMENNKLESNKMVETLVSVIIVNWNGLKWLQKCLNSIESQTYKHVEVILTDNNSTDGSVDYIKNNYPNINLIISNKNLGFANGNNLAINKSEGEFILLLNTDAWVENNFIEKIVNEYKSGEFDILSPKEVDYEGNDLNYSLNRTIDLLGHPYFETKNSKTFYLQGVCLFFKKELYLKTRGLDNNFFMYFEETDWFWRLNLLNKKIKNLSNLKVNHFGAGSTDKGGFKYNNFLWRNQNTLQMLIKNYSLINLLWVIPIYILQNILEVIFLLMIGKFKIASTYLSSYAFIVKNWEWIILERKWVQKNRIISDYKIIKKMYLGFAKISHLYDYIIK